MFKKIGIIIYIEFLIAYLKTTINIRYYFYNSKTFPTFLTDFFKFDFLIKTQNIKKYI